MKVTFWGTRGSVAVPGPETTRYGGNTSCVEVRACADSVVVLDAGTGLRRLGLAMGPEVRRVDVLLTHLHADHVQGLGFFAPLFQPGFDVHIWGPASSAVDLGTRLSRYFAPPLFPVTLSDLLCCLTLHEAVGSFALPGLDVTTDLVCHPGPTVGYRISDQVGSLAYLPDHELAIGGSLRSGPSPWSSGFDLAADVDLLIHDAQYSADEYAAHVGCGHSSIRDAVDFAFAARVGKLILFHHDPAHDDLAIDRLLFDALACSGSSLEIAAAREDTSYEVGRVPAA